MIGILPATVSGFELDGVGLRTGFGSENNEDFLSAEALLLLDTPFEWSLSERAEIEFELEGTAGVLDSDSETAAIVHAGLVASLEFEDLPFSFVVSSGPTFLSEDEYGDYDLGGNFHFTSAAGIDFDFFGDWQVGYRFMHISNAGTDEPNPGLNLHALSAVLDF